MSLLDSQSDSQSDSQGPGSGQQSDAPAGLNSTLKKILPYTTIAIVLAMIYVAYVFYSRHQSDVEAEAKIEEQKQANLKRTVDAVFGNGEIKFNQFSIDTRSLKRGETARLCYGVENAAAVKLDPPVENIKPSYLHCLDISPKVTTKYTITAEDGKGHSKSESLELQVHN